MLDQNDIPQLNVLIEVVSVLITTERCEAWKLA